MRLFHRASQEAGKSILRDGFKDKTDPTGTNLGLYDQIPEIKAVWFNDVPLDVGDGRVFLLEIPDKIVQQVDTTVRMGLWGRSSLPHFNRYRPNVPEAGEGFAITDELVKPYTEFLIPAEIANQYGPPIDITGYETEFLPDCGLF